MGTTLGQWLVAISLALVGVNSILYAGYMTVPLVEQPVEIIWWVVGAASLVAAVGVLRWAAWARVLGIGVLVVYGAWAVWSVVRSMLGVDILDSLTVLLGIDLLIMVGLSLALWWLVTRWRPPRRAAAASV